LILLNILFVTCCAVVRAQNYPARPIHLRKHGIDFVDAEKIFRGFTLTVEDDRGAYGEQRFLTLMLL